MSLNDIFKSFFGFKDPFKGGNSKENFPDFDEEDFSEDFHDGQHGGFDDDVFKHFHQSMFSQMEELFRQMDDMFHNSGRMDFPPAIEGPYQRKPENPRDYMLKEPDDFEKQPNIQNPRITPKDDQYFKPRTFFGIFSPPVWKRPDIKDRQDKDIDGEVQVDDLVDLFKNPQHPGPSHTPSAPPGNSPWSGPGHIPSFSPEHSPWPGNGSSRKSSSWSFSWSSNGNMKSEERRTVRDSAGNEETTVTRSIGDQSHSVTTKKDNSGMEERIENFQNIDSDDLSKFNEQWNSKSHVNTQNPRDKMLSPPPSSNDKSQNKSFFEKLFGL